MFAISQDETRYTYNGVFMETEADTLRLVATDGHRLAMIERPSEGLVLDEGVIVHKKALGELVKLLQGVEVTYLFLLPMSRAGRVCLFQEKKRLPL